MYVGPWQEYELSRMCQEGGASEFLDGLRRAWLKQVKDELGSSSADPDALERAAAAASERTVSLVRQRAPRAVPGTSVPVRRAGIGIRRRRGAQSASSERTLVTPRSVASSRGSKGAKGQREIGALRRAGSASVQSASPGMRWGAAAPPKSGGQLKPWASERDDVSVASSWASASGSPKSDVPRLRRPFGGTADSVGGESTGRVERDGSGSGLPSWLRREPPSFGQRARSPRHEKEVLRSLERHAPSVDRMDSVLGAREARMAASALGGNIEKRYDSSGRSRQVLRMPGGATVDIASERTPSTKPQAPKPAKQQAMRTQDVEKMADVYRRGIRRERSMRAGDYDIVMEEEERRIGGEENTRNQFSGGGGERIQFSGGGGENTQNQISGGGGETAQNQFSGGGGEAAQKQVSGGLSQEMLMQMLLEQAQRQAELSRQLEEHLARVRQEDQLSPPSKSPTKHTIPSSPFRPPTTSFEEQPSAPKPPPSTSNSNSLTSYLRFAATKPTNKPQEQKEPIPEPMDDDIDDLLKWTEEL